MRLGDIFVRRLVFGWRFNFYRTRYGWLIEAPLFAMERFKDWRAFR